MRFGIMAMQLHKLIPSNLSPAQALDYVSSFEHAALVRDLYGHGFNPIELGGDLGMFMPQTFLPPAIEALAALKEELGVTYTVHLPLWSVEPSTPLPPVRHGSARALIDTVQATLPLDPEVYVLHATGALAAEFYRMQLPPVGRAVILRQFQNGALESIRTLLAETGIPSRRLAIETIEFPFELTLGMAEQFDLSLCLDTGHVLAGFSGTIDGSILDFFDVLEACLPRLTEIHLHDALIPKNGAIVYGTDHSPLGTGDLDTAHLLKRLDAAGFDGPVIFELTVEEARQSLEVIRQIEPAAPAKSAR